MATPAPGLVILHLSDLHFGNKNRFQNRNLADFGKQFSRSVREALNEQRWARPIDVVVISGDIAEVAKPSEFEQGRVFLTALLEGLDLKPEQAIFIPGNHDISWTQCKRVDLERQEEEFDKDEYHRRLDAVKFKFYSEFLQNFYGWPDTNMDHLPGRTLLHTPSGAYLRDFNVDGLPVSFAALNTSETETHTHHGGELSREQAQALIDAWMQPEYEGHLKIAIVHHNPLSTPSQNLSWTTEYFASKIEANNLEVTPEWLHHYTTDMAGFKGADLLERIVYDANAHLVLHGHHHNPTTPKLWPNRTEGIAPVLSVGSFGLNADQIPDDQPLTCQLLFFRQTPSPKLLAVPLEFDPNFALPGVLDDGQFRLNVKSRSAYDRPFTAPNSWVVSSPEVASLAIPSAALEEEDSPNNETSLVAPSASDTIWSVPHRANPYFTGRSELLKELREKLVSDHRVALNGLAGIGKTQTALAYAHEHRNDYSAVFWVRANNQETLLAGFTAIARVLDLPIKDDKEQSLIINAVKAWLEREKNWLVIFDNADTVEALEDFIPETEGGHILLTTRAQATDTSSPVNVFKMEPTEGALFVLRRAKRVGRRGRLEDASEQDQALAQEISQKMGGLPLALDQAGAFIDEMQISLRRYLDLYEEEGAKLLKERGRTNFEHESVSVTFSMAFKQVETNSKAAADLIRVCAFLAPDDIPDEFFSLGTSELGNELSIASSPYELTKIIAEAGRFSLIYRDRETDSIDIHRLVQEVIRTEMDRDTHSQWVERIISALDRVFPDASFETWAQCARLIPHIIVACDFMTQNDLTIEAGGQLLIKAGQYIAEQGNYILAAKLVEESLRIRQSQLDSDDLKIGESLNNLGVVYLEQGDYVISQQYIERAITIRETALNSKPMKFADSIGNLASFYLYVEDYAMAESLALLVVKLRKKETDKRKSRIDNTLNALATIYAGQGKNVEAERLYLEAIEISTEVNGPEHPETVQCTANLASVYGRLGKKIKAEETFKSALELQEKNLGINHPDVAYTLHNLASFYNRHKNFSKAKQLFKRCLAIREATLGMNHPLIADTLRGYAKTLIDSRQFIFEAKKMEKRAISIEKRNSRQNTLSSGDEKSEKTSTSFAEALLARYSDLPD